MISLVWYNAHRKGRGVTELGKPTLVLCLCRCLPLRCQPRSIASPPHPYSHVFPLSRSLRTFLRSPSNAISSLSYGFSLPFPLPSSRFSSSRSISYCDTRRLRPSFTLQLRTSDSFFQANPSLNHAEAKD